MKWLLKIKMNNDCVIDIRGVEYGFDVEYVECIIPDGDTEEQQRKIVQFLINDVNVQLRGYHESMQSAIQEVINHLCDHVEDLSCFCGGGNYVAIEPYVEPIVI